MPYDVVAEPAHQGVEGASHPGHRPAAVDQRRAEAEARDGRYDDGERVLGRAAVRDRIGQRADHVEEVDERPRVGVGQQQRRRALDRRRDVDEVHGLAVDLGQVVRELVHPLLLRPPVEPVLPVVDHLAEVVVRGAVVPVVAGNGLGQPRPREAGEQIVQVSLGDVDGEGPDALVRGHGFTVESV